MDIQIQCNESPRLSLSLSLSLSLLPMDPAKFSEGSCVDSCPTTFKEVLPAFKFIAEGFQLGSPRLLPSFDGPTRPFLCAPPNPIKRMLLAQFR